MADPEEPKFRGERFCVPHFRIGVGEGADSRVVDLGVPKFKTGISRGQQIQQEKSGGPQIQRQKFQGTPDSVGGYLEDSRFKGGRSDSSPI